MRKSSLPSRLLHQLNRVMRGSNKPVAALVLAAAFGIAAPTTQAIVHLTGPSTTYTTAPSNGLPWGNVGKFCDISGNNISGSIVSIRGKYCLTANHVSLREYVSFNGVTKYRRDTGFTPVRIGTADLKLFKLEEDPGLPELSFNTTALLDTFVHPMYLVGWGVGIAAGQTSPEVINGHPLVWRWGNTATTAKRWGTNRAHSVFNYSDSSYTYSAIYAQMEPNHEASEAALATYDSGSAAFILHNGKWLLSGIGAQASSVAQANSSSFSTVIAERDMAHWVRLSSQYAKIVAALPDVTTFSGWLLDNGLSGANAAADADPDNDSVTNLAEFAFGGNPNANDTSQIPHLAGDVGSIKYRYRLSKFTTGISVQAMHSDNMMTWTALPGTPVVVEDTDDYTVYEIGISPSNTGHRFYTVRVTQL